VNIYDYQRPVGKIDDDVELRNTFIRLYDSRDHQTIARFCIAYGKHLISMTGFPADKAIEDAFVAIERWLEGKTNYHEARNLSSDIHTLARNENNPVRARFYRTLAQMAAVPHVKYHGLWMTDFAITLINRMHPKDEEAVAKQRQCQISILQSL
jgi:hypothetical protein